MPSQYLKASEPITVKNYQLKQTSELLPLSDKGGQKISIPTQNFKQAYSANEFEDMHFDQKKSDKLDEDETMPNFMFQLDDN